MCPTRCSNNLKHNKVLHERVILLTVKIADVPYVVSGHRMEFTDLGQGFYRMVINYGFMEDPDVPGVLSQTKTCGPRFQDDGHQLLPGPADAAAVGAAGHGDLARRSCSPGCSATPKARWSSFKLPTNRVVELGSQVEI